MPTPPGYAEEIAAKTKSLLTKLRAPEKTSTFFIEHGEFFDSKTIAEKTGILDESSLCLSLGSVQPDNWKTIEEGKSYELLGEKNMYARAYVLCDMEKFMPETLENPPESDYLSDFKKEYFSNCTINEQSTGKYCVVSLTGGTLTTSSPSAWRATDIYLFLLLFILSLFLVLGLNTLITFKLFSSIAKKLFFAKILAHVVFWGTMVAGISSAILKIPVVSLLYWTYPLLIIAYIVFLLTQPFLTILGYFLQAKEKKLGLKIFLLAFLVELGQSIFALLVLLFAFQLSFI